MGTRPLLPALLSASLLVGCASAEEQDPAAATDALRANPNEDAAGAFAVDYGLGWLAGHAFHTIDRDRLFESLPEAARTQARCLESRRDVVRGNTLRGSRWRFERDTFFVLEVDLEDRAEIRDATFAFVFREDGSSAFQALSWANKRNVKIAYRQPVACAPTGE